MKIDHQENCEYRFSSISIDFHQLSSILSIFINIIDFLLFHFNFREKCNGQEISFVCNKRKGIQRKLLIVGAHFPLIKLLS